MKKTMMRSKFLVPLYFCAFFSAVSPAMAADPDNGADIFAENCSDCHSVSSSTTNRKGPSLYHVVGRKAGTVPAAHYSAALLASHLIWNEQTLNRYLANPQSVIPNGIMKFKGLQSASDRADVIAYLASIR